VVESYQKARDEWLSSKLADLAPEERDMVARAASILERLARAS